MVAAVAVAVMMAAGRVVMEEEEEEEEKDMHGIHSYAPGLAAVVVAVVGVGGGG